MTDTFYVDPVVQAKIYGISVLVDDPQNPKILKEKEDGAILEDANGITIYVSNDSSLERQRFTIAHELGHYISGHLDKNHTMFRDGKIYNQDNYDFKEYEANRYAAELLMPVHKLTFLLETQGVNTLEGLAKALIVSKKAMEIRLKKLGWIS